MFTVSLQLKYLQGVLYQEFHPMELRFPLCVSSVGNMDLYMSVVQQNWYVYVLIRHCDLLAL